MTSKANTRATPPDTLELIEAVKDWLAESVSIDLIDAPLFYARLDAVAFRLSLSDVKSADAYVKRALKNLKLAGYVPSKIERETPPNDPLGLTYRHAIVFGRGRSLLVTHSNDHGWSIALYDGYNGPNRATLERADQRDAQKDAS